MARALAHAPREGLQIVRLGRPALDLERPQTIQAALAGRACDVLVNAAAYTAVDAAETAPERAFAINAVAPGVLAEACAARGAAILHLSTDYVFDGAKGSPYLERDTPAPLNVYGASKLAGERAVAAACPRHLILRTSWVFAPYGRNFLRTMLQAAAEGRPLAVVDDQRGRPTYAPDLATAVLALAQRLGQDRGGQSGGLFHLAGEGEATWWSFAEEIFAQSRAAGGPFATPSRLRTLDYPRPAVRPPDSRLDCTAIMAAHGLRLRPWREAVAACIADIAASGFTI